ncbi:hypothetical protein D770_15045 [Flammeovirgaceae bacterium 311]|nr:hypothetical protein D770_15045 [Flammeovirgaceae bacterium 311]
MSKIYGLLIFILISTLFQIEALAQRETYRADDGTQVDVNIVSVDPDAGRNTSIFLGYFGPEGAHILGANHYKPGKYFINGLVGKTGAHIDGSIFFATATKQIKLKQSVKMTHNTKYVIKVPALKHRSFGLHMGANMVDYSKLVEATGYHSTTGVFGGFSLLKAKHTHWKIHDSYGEAQGTMINRLNADIIYYFNTESTYYSTSDLEVGTRKIGARLYYDGKATIWSRQGRLSINYMLGVGINSARESIPLFAGFGVGYNF